MANTTVYPYGTGGSLPSSIGLVNDLETGGVDKALTAAQGKFLGDFLFGKNESVNLSSITVSDYSLGSASDWSGLKGTHIVVPVVEGERYTLDVTGGTGGGGWYGLLTDSYAVPAQTTDSVPYVSGTNRIWKAPNTPLEITIPSGCAYVCLCPKDGSANTATWSMVKNYQDRDETFMDKIGEIDGIKSQLYTYTLSQIDISVLTVQVGSLGATEWYASKNNPRHIAVPVIGNSTIQLRCDSSYGYYGFVTSSYSTPVAHASTIPYASGTGRNTLFGTSGEIGISVPSDAAYLILTMTDGGGTSAAWSVWNKTIITLDEAFREHCVHVGDSSSVGGGSTRIKVATWNVGCFSLGATGTSTITPSNFETMKNKWRVALNSIGADILCCCEYDTNFMEAGSGYDEVEARDAVFTDDIFGDAKIGPKISNAYMQTAIFANLELGTPQVVYFNDTIASGGRYYQVVDINIGGEQVKLVNAHLDFSYSADPSDSGRVARLSQMQQLITTFSDDEHVIICGDFNVNHGNENDYDTFISAGYKMANHGYLGNISTYPAGNDPIAALDNIVYKGFVSSKIEILNDSTLSDHAAFFADLTLIRSQE